jgi:hypothetical protein
MEEVGERSEAVKVGDVFITFIFVLSFVGGKRFGFLGETFFYDCSELKCFYVR